MTQLSPAIIQAQQKEENFLLKDDLISLTSAEKAKFYKDLCTHIGVDPITKPFGLYSLQGKEVLYIKANCFDQLCAKNRVSRKIIPQDVIIGEKVIKQDFVTMGDPSIFSEVCYLVKVEASKIIEGEKVTAEDIAQVPQFEWNKFDKKWTRNNNALMKAVTKGYRRAAQKLISIGSVLLEDDLDKEQGQIREISEAGESVGGPTLDKLDIRLPKSYLGCQTLKELMLKHGDESLQVLDQKLNKEPVSEEWKTIRQAINAYFDLQQVT